VSRSIWADRIAALFVAAAAGFLAARAVALWLPEPPAQIRWQSEAAKSGPAISLRFICQKRRRAVSDRPLADAQILRGVRLAAIYLDDRGGFVALQTPKGVEFVYPGQKYRGFTLKSVAPNHAIFERDGKEAVLYLEEGTSSSAKSAPAKISATFVESAEVVRIPRSVVERMRRDPAALIRQIGLRPVRYEGEQAYEVIYVAKGSPFEWLGIKKGDIIVSIDGKKLDNPMVLTRVMQSDLERLRVKIVRDEIIKDIEYEIE